jgi:hypothetical protein
MGGRLSIRVEFPDGMGRELTGLVQPHSVGPGEESSETSASAPTPAKSLSGPPRARPARRRPPIG